MKIAVIGTGIAGNVAAYHLSREHDITVYEANNYVGGHTHTHDVCVNGKYYAIDSGFIVFNYRTYPNFVKLLTELDVSVRPTEMSFSVKCERTGLEYSGSGLNGLFSQRSNCINPRFYCMLYDIFRFNREAPELLDGNDNNISLGQYLADYGYSEAFINNYLIPMGSAIWSADQHSMNDIPASFFIRFFNNHGLLTVTDHPQWHVIEGGSKKYVEVLTRPFRDRIRTNSRVVSVERKDSHIEVTDHQGYRDDFDRVFFACHSNQALAMIKKPSITEQQVLGAIQYQMNEAILHTDTRPLPSATSAWAAWNYLIPASNSKQVTVTYNMNILQGIQAPDVFCVTLNSPVPIKEECIISRVYYEHPLFTPMAIDAQRRHRDINGEDRFYFCGAYWRYGFHEDGVVSALEALQHFQDREYDEQLHLRRAG